METSESAASTPLQSPANTTITTTTTTTTAPDGTNRDSMVTVPLSDVQSNSEHTQSDWRSLDIPVTPTDPNALKSDPAGGSSTRSPSSERNDTGDEAEGDVDWAQLDKTEEQEPRGEGSDEVCCSIFTTSDAG